MAEERANWKVLDRLVQSLFMLCFKDKNLQTLKRENAMKRLVDTLIRALESRQIDVVI